MTFQVTQDTLGTPYSSSDVAFDLPTKLFTVDRSSPKQIHFYLEATIEGSVAYLEIDVSINCLVESVSWGSSVVYDMSPSLTALTIDLSSMITLSNPLCPMTMLLVQDSLGSNTPFISSDVTLLNQVITVDISSIKVVSFFAEAAIDGSNTYLQVDISVNCLAETILWGPE
jgi:hypothetical protein